MSELMQAEIEMKGQKWPMVKLGEICHTVTKGTTPTSLGYEFSNKGTPFLRIQNISNNTVSLDDVLYIDKETNEALKRSKIIPGDLLITIAGTIGKTAIVPEDFPECNCNQALAIIRFDSNKLLPKYLLYWLGTNSALSQITGMKVTATISNLSLGQIKELVIPLPPLEEQKRIAAILDKADAIRRKRQQAIKLADDFLRSVFLDMFGDPVTNPKGWEVVNSGDLYLASPKIGTTTPAKEEGCLVVRVGELGQFNIAFERCGRVLLSEADFDKFVLVPGDTVLARAIGSKNQLGKASYYSGYTESVVIDSHVMRLRPNNEICNPEWFYRFVSSDGGKSLLQKAGGATAVQFNINAKQVSELKIPLPPLALQNKFIELCSSHLKSSNNCFTQERRIHDLFNSLTQKVFLGQL